MTKASTTVQDPGPNIAERAGYLVELTATASRSTLLITDDLEGLDQMDEIAALEHGQVAERGTHTELVRSGSAYQRL
jgi:ABC-type transport system involved in Fe-S cluster assembly fused permease/ATPase subunit